MMFVYAVGESCCDDGCGSGDVTLTCDSARILGLFMSPSKSHQIVHMATIRPMIERGHDVTIVSTISIKEPGLKFRHIHIDSLFVRNQPVNLTVNMFRRILGSMTGVLKHTYETLNDPKMQKLMKEESFDLVVLGYFVNDFLIGVAGHFNCPIIVNWMNPPVRNLANLVGNPAEVFYVPTWLSGLKQPMGFLDRIKNFMAASLEVILYEYLDYQIRHYYNYNFPSDKYRSYDEMKRNVSMLFVNSFLNQGPIQPNVPAMVQIGGIQVKPKPDPLPEDIKKHLDSASQHGVIYFCLGSNLNNSHLSAEFIEATFGVLSSLKQKVIWKWEGDQLPGLTSNILFKKWLPQDDILAHPNVKLFITHSGAGGIAEAQYHGVPMLGLPFSADQFSNCQKIQIDGYGVCENHETLTKESFRKALLEVLENSRYRENVQTFSKVFRDRPMSARETAAYWMEYVIRHKGAKHLQSPAVHMNTIQYYGLDVLGFLAAIVYMSFKLLQFLWRKTVCKLFRKFCGKKEAKKKIQ